jgi:uncharacterized protein (DUF58 family)
MSDESPGSASKSESLKFLLRELSFRDLRNVILGSLIVFGGVILALITVYAHRTGNVQLAGITAGISLVFALVILIFVVPPLARNAHREAQQLNLPFEITLSGSVMLVLIFVVGFSAWNTGNNLLFLVFSFLVGAVFIGFLGGGLSLKKLDVKLRLPETIFANEPTPISMTLENRKRLLPAFSTVVDVRGTSPAAGPAGQHLANLLPSFLARRVGRTAEVRRTLAYFSYLGARSTQENRINYLFDKRGLFTIQNFELSTRFPFGFFRHRRRLSARETELVVFPQLAELGDIDFEAPVGAGRATSSKIGVGHDLLSLRDYRHDDDLRKIDWKATARSQHLTVREFAAEDELRVSVVFDGREATPERFERGVSLAAAAITQLFNESAEFRLVIGEEGEFGTGRGHWLESLTRLASVLPYNGPPSILDSPKGRISYTILVTGTADVVPTEAPLKIIRF